MFQPSVRNSMSWDNNGTLRSDWNFDTIKSSAAMGSLRNMAKDLLTPGMELQEDVEDEDSDYEPGDGSIDTTAATQGSDPPIGGLGMNSQAAHSTVIIKPSRIPGTEKDLPALVTSEENTSGDTSSPSPETPPQNGFAAPPPAYSGSMRSQRRSSYAARNVKNGPGMVLREADLGTGVDTIRPMKKVDTVGSLKMSAEFVGSMRRNNSDGSLPPSPSKLLTHKRRSSEVAKAGIAVVDEVVIPILQNVRIVIMIYL
jgi:serine/threonine-protein kinase 24/25/MST4